MTWLCPVGAITDRPRLLAFSEGGFGAAEIFTPEIPTFHSAKKDLDNQLY